MTARGHVRLGRSPTSVLGCNGGMVFVFLLCALVMATALDRLSWVDVVCVVVFALPMVVAFLTTVELRSGSLTCGIGPVRRTIVHLADVDAFVETAD